MKHFLFFKYGRIYFEKIYELWGDYETALNFQKSLSKTHNYPVIMCEVI